VAIAFGEWPISASTFFVSGKFAADPRRERPYLCLAFPAQVKNYLLSAGAMSRVQCRGCNVNDRKRR
jgi:hypothetical protein